MKLAAIILVAIAGVAVLCAVSPAADTLEMERSGDAKSIFDKWFGPHSPAPLKRGAFKIKAEK